MPDILDIDLAMRSGGVVHHRVSLLRFDFGVWFIPASITLTIRKCSVRLVILLMLCILSNSVMWGASKQPGAAAAGRIGRGLR